MDDLCYANTGSVGIPKSKYDNHAHSHGTNEYFENQSLSAKVISPCRASLENNQVVQNSDIEPQRKTQESEIEPHEKACNGSDAD